MLPENLINFDWIIFFLLLGRPGQKGDAGLLGPVETLGKKDLNIT